MPLTEVSAGAKVTETGLSLVSALRRAVMARRDLQRARRDLAEALGIRRDNDYSYRSAAMHPRTARSARHPNDEAALVALIGAELDAHVPLADVVDDLPTSLEDGLVLVGSAEAVSRLAFGYSRRSEDGGVERVGRPVALPLRWEEEVPPESTSRRYNADGSVVERPNWPVLSKGLRGDSLFFPTLHLDGFLRDDLLLITKVPNYLTARARQSNWSIIHIAGAHGPGTRAVELLLADDAIVRDIARLRPWQSNAFQLLLQVGDFDHNPQTGSRAQSIQLMDCRVLEPLTEQICAPQRYRSNATCPLGERA